MTQIADLYLDISSVESGALPAELQESMARHRRHVGDLAEKMRAIGMDDDAIELGITSLMESYRSELSAALRQMNGASL
ncbi:hypothetical protein MKP08_13730 [Erythrobacter sp. LQ02-29]|uniref:hypothetical protein n=1 Tax=Erythrobacter sp. LQ02-29 TaxID=2920384 RepID=UPI001F4DAE17|nr:hypothetical protein [Erythrobacter sp. LQ02-29]MCP9223803.1 hypothetical protein [Erythrobacter sp. LQ02-29]